MMKFYRRWIVLGLVLLMLAVGTAVYANINAGYSINKSVVAGGGHQASTGGSYSLTGTAGQTAVDTVAGGSYVFSSGFWTTGNQTYGIYLPMILRQ